MLRGSESDARDWTIRHDLTRSQGEPSDRAVVKEGRVYDPETMPVLAEGLAVNWFEWSLYQAPDDRFVVEKRFRSLDHPAIQEWWRRWGLLFPLVVSLAIFSLIPAMVELASGGGAFPLQDWAYVTLFATLSGLVPGALATIVMGGVKGGLRITGRHDQQLVVESFDGLPCEAKNFTTLQAVVQHNNQTLHKVGERTKTECFGAVEDVIELYCRSDGRWFERRYMDDPSEGEAIEPTTRMSFVSAFSTTRNSSCIARPSVAFRTLSRPTRPRRQPTMILNRHSLLL